MKKSTRRLCLLLFALYALLLLLLLLFQRTPRSGHSYNLVPLRTIRGYWLVLSREIDGGLPLLRYAVTNFAGNLLAFLPLGFFLPLLFSRQRRFPLFLLTAVGIIVLVELLQLLSRRGALDVDDLLLNLPGACLGWLIWALASRRKAKKDSS